MHFKSLLLSIPVFAGMLCGIPEASAADIPAGATIILSEDFAKFTGGSFGAPDEYNDLAWAGISDYTQTPGWDGEEIYAAGGSCYIGKGWFMPGSLKTPKFDGTVNDGSYTLSFRACGTAADNLGVNRKDASGERVKETVALTTEWQDFSIDFTGGSAADIIEFVPAAEAMYIDDIVVYYAPAGVSAPEGAVLFEPFDSFSEGTEADPVAFKDDNGVIPDNATRYPGWRGRGLFQAGGCAYLGSFGADNPQPGYLQTPEMNLSGNGGKFTVTFKAREYDFGFGFGAINVTVYDAVTGSQVYNNYADITSEWSDCSVGFSCGMERCYLRFSSALGEAYIDDIAVVQAAGSIAAPVALGWSGLTDGGFTASWSEVEGADSYLLSVYTGSSNRSYIIEDKAVDGLSARVDGIDIYKLCYYVVKAVCAAGVSNESNQVMVLGLPSPELMEASDITAGGFTARWGLVDRATAYLLTVWQTTTVAEAGTFDIIDEDFSGFSGGTFAAPAESSAMDQTLDQYIGRADWTCHLLAWVDGALGIDNRWIGEYGASWVRSAVFDMSGSDGKVDIAMRHYGQDIKDFTVSLCDAKGNIINSHEVASIASWSDDSFTLEGADGECYILISLPSSQSGVLYLDDLRVSRAVAAGDVITVPVIGKEVAKPYASGATMASAEVRVPSWAENEAYSYSVRARRLHYDSDYVGYAYSKPETVQAVARPSQSGVAGVDAGGAVSVVCGADGVVAIVAPDGAPFVVSSVSGTVVASGSGSATVQLPAHGVYIVSAAGKVSKFVW